jgi:hypothetical protein
MIALLHCLLLVAPALPQWNFDATDTSSAWQANAHHAETLIADGALQTTTIGEDPILFARDLDVAVTPWQLLLIRMRCDRSGSASLYWTGTNEPPYEGLSEAKRNTFTVTGGPDWQEIAIYPGWHREGHINKLRLDFFGDARIAIDWIKIVDWREDRTPATTLGRDTPGIALDWYRPTPAPLWLSPPLSIPADGHGFVSVELDRSEAQQGALFWSTTEGTHRTHFEVEPDGPRTYNIEVQSAPGWAGEIQMLALELSRPTAAPPNAIHLTDAPQGPPHFVVDYCGPENAINRAEQPSSLLLHLRNIGGASGESATLEWNLPGLSSSEYTQTFQVPEWGEPIALRCNVQGAAPATYPVTAHITLPGAKECQASGTLNILPTVPAVALDYVPAPQPVPVAVDVLTYYFPGWPNAAAWDPIRGTAPGRKPLLGYYDEANPEVVDWQIKWSLENGINGYLVDWYWTRGSQHLTHWFDAYRKARYRDQLKVAIMWANHNPPGSHSAEDWRAVTKEWIEHYFTLTAYYRIDGKPAIFLWDPRNLRNDLGGSDAVRAALAESQAMAQTAGYPGITFVTLFGHATTAETAMLQHEGYHGITSYHEWGNAPALGDSPLRMRYDDVVATAPKAWDDARVRGGSLVYYPCIDTGWDARPWHGTSSQVIAGRSVAGFSALLSAGRAYAEKHALPFVVLGPANEWGEGSYIEPCTEFGFDMFEAVRTVFATAPKESWPVNLAPADVGRGPYDLPIPAPRTRWTFEADEAGWAPMMNLGSFQVADGLLHTATTGTDPAMRVLLSQIQGRDYAALEIEMRCTPAADAVTAPGTEAMQLFWSMAGRATEESASLRVPILCDGDWHTYRFDLASAPRWRGRVSSLRLDPANRANLTLAFRRLELVPAQQP